MDAIELLEDPPIPEWQKKRGTQTPEDLQKNPSKAVSWNKASKKIKQLAK